MTTQDQLIPPYVISIDGGTESLRASIFDRFGHRLCSAACAYPTRFPQSGWAEQDPADWWRALVDAVHACLAQCPVPLENIQGICVDATTCTLVFLDYHFHPLRPALLWMDVRAADQAERVFATGHPALRYSLAGCNAEWMLPKVMWVAENEPEIYAQTYNICEMTDYLIYRLTGRVRLGLNTITQRWFYNTQENGWPTSLFDAVGLPGLVQRFPEKIVQPGQRVDRLLANLPDILGLPDQVPVFEGGGDAFIGLLGLNVAEPGKVGLITGSSNVIGAFVEDENHQPGLYGGFPDAVVPGLWLMEGGQSSTGSILNWFKRNFALDLPDEQAYRLLDQEAASVPPGSDGLVVLDYFQGNRTPYTDSKARGMIWGLSLHSTRAQVFRALMEGVAYGTRQVLEALSESGTYVQSMVACGGATRSPLFMQIYADVCGVPISTTRVSDAPMLGDAILAFYGLKFYPDLPTAARSMVEVVDTYRPDPANHAAYSTLFQLYKQTFPQMRELMHQMADRRA
jgi:ribulokinase